MLSPLQLAILDIIANGDRPYGLSEVETALSQRREYAGAKYLDLESNIRSCLRELRRRGYIASREDDPRNPVYAITPAGRHWLEIESRRSAFLPSLSSCLGGCLGACLLGLGFLAVVGFGDSWIEASGLVVGPNGSPLSGATINLAAVGPGKGGIQKESDTSGHFSIRLMTEPGLFAERDFLLRVGKEGYVPYQARITQSAFSLVVMLKKKE